MQRLCRLATGMALLVTLALGCGSTADNRLVLRFTGFHSAGIEQLDSVRETSADVDAVQDLCEADAGASIAAEPFTQTTINATFRNEQMSDIRLDSYVIHFNDPRTGLADIAGSLSGRIVGGRCSNGDTPCAVNADCAAGGGTTTVSVTCVHQDTTVRGILLFDFDAKAHVSPRIFGEATSVTITFFGSDANRSFRTTAGYVVTFDNFDNCTAAAGGAGAS